MTDKQIKRSRAAAAAYVSPAWATQKSDVDLFDLDSDYAREVHDRLFHGRFGSDCRHERTSRGVCCNCLRKVVS